MHLEYVRSEGRMNYVAAVSTCSLLVLVSLVVGFSWSLPFPLCESQLLTMLRSLFGVCYHIVSFFNLGRQIEYVSFPSGFLSLSLIVFLRFGLCASVNRYRVDHLLLRFLSWYCIRRRY